MKLHLLEDLFDTVYSLNRMDAIHQESWRGFYEGKAQGLIHALAYFGVTVQLHWISQRIDRITTTGSLTSVKRFSC